MNSCICLAQWIREIGLNLANIAHSYERFCKTCQKHLILPQGAKSENLRQKRVLKDLPPPPPPIRDATGHKKSSHVSEGRRLPQEPLRFTQKQLKPIRFAQQITHLYAIRVYVIVFGTFASQQCIGSVPLFKTTNLSFPHRWNFTIYEVIYFMKHGYGPARLWDMTLCLSRSDKLSRGRQILGNCRTHGSRTLTSCWFVQMF